MCCHKIHWVPTAPITFLGILSHNELFALDGITVNANGGHDFFQHYKATSLLPISWNYLGRRNAIAIIHRKQMFLHTK